ncbi:MAG: hypothetical protein VW397_08930, partial [Candidatus Margulisiibacteriota bacterium]
MNVGNSYRSEIRLNRPACYRGGELTYLQHVINSSVPPSPSELRKLTAYLTEKIIRTSPSELSKYAEDIKGLFKILKKSGSEASFRKLIESLNKIKAKRLRSEDHVLWAANFIKKDTLLKMAEKCLDNQGIKQARYYLMSYFLCFKKGEIIDEENELTIRKIINTSAEAFQSTSYLKQGVNDIEKQGQVIHKEMFMDLVFLKMGEAVFNDQSGKHIEPYKVIQKLIGSLIVTKASFNEDTTNPPIKFTETQRILIDDGYHGEADKVIFYEDEHSQEDKTITSEEHYIETVNTTSDSNQIDEHASLSYSNGTQRANQHSDNATLSEQRSANQNSERRENEMARGGRQDIADQSASKTLSTDQKTSNLRNDGTRNLGSKSIGETYESMACKERGVRTKNGKESVTAWKKNESTNPRNIGVSFGGVGFDMAVKNDSSSTDNSSEEREQNSNENSDTRTNRDTSGIRDELRTDEEITRNSTTDVSYQTGGSSSAHNNSTHTVTNDLESGSASVNMTSEGQGVSTTRSNERMVSSHDDHNQSGSFDVRGHRDHSSGGSQMFHGTDHAEHNSTISKIHLERQTKTLKKGHYYFQMIEKELNVEDQKVNAIFTYSGLSFENLDQYRRIKEPALKPLVERLTNVVYRRSFSEYHRKKTQRKKNIISSFELNNDKFLQIIELVRAFNNIKKQYGDYWLKIEGYKDNEKQWHEAISECFRVCALKEPDKRLIEMKYKELFKIFYSLILNPDFNLSLEGTFLNKLNEFTKRIYGGEIPKFPPNEGSGVIFHHDDGTNGFYLGNGTISLDHSYKHVLIKGSTGIGKSSQIFIPGILALNDENALVTDI